MNWHAEKVQWRKQRNGTWALVEVGGIEVYARIHPKQDGHYRATYTVHPDLQPEQEHTFTALRQAKKVVHVLLEFDFRTFDRLYLNT
jgi:hypothetical protein